MILGLVPASVFADVAEGLKSNDVEKKIVVFGNSASSGYGMPDYWSSRNGFSLRNNDLNQYKKEDAKLINEGRMSTDAYPWRLKKYIAEHEFDGDYDKVNLTSFALQGMRIDEALAFLDEDFYNSSIAREDKYRQRWNDEHPDRTKDSGEGFLTKRVRSYYNSFYNCHATEEGTYEAGSAFVQSNVKDADVVVLDACNNDFGTYVGFRVAAFAGMGFREDLPNTYETIDDVDGVPSSVKKSIMAVEKALEKTGILADPLTKQLVDSYVFATASCVVNYSSIVKHIRELNPDAKIIAVSIANVNRGMRVQMGDNVIDLGDYLGELFKIINFYIKALDKNANHVYYADLQGDISTIANSIVEKDTLEEIFADGPADGLLRNDAGEVVEDDYGNPLMDVRSNYSLHQMGAGFIDEYLKGMFSTDPETGGETFYNTVLSAMLQTLPQPITLKPWEEMDDDDVVTGESDGAPGVPLYMAFDFEQTDVTKMIKFDHQGTLYPIGKIDDENTTAYITKANIDKVVRRIYQLLLDGIHHNTIDIMSIASMFSDPDAMSKDIMQFIFGAVDEAPDATLGLLFILMRFIMGNAIGEHPDSEGCAQKYVAVHAAYLSEMTGAEQTREEIRQRIREIIQEIKDISKCIEDTVKREVYEKLIKELMPLIEELKEMGVAIYNLPEYEELVDSYAEAIGLMQETTFILVDKVATLEVATGELQNKVDALERNVQELEQQAQFTDKTMMELQARSVRVQFNSSVTFPANKVKVTVSWDRDEDADGYVFKVNGAVKEPKATLSGFTYVDEAAQVGETYKFEVQPYVLYKGQQINGKLFKTTVVPKVKLSKGVITSLKKGTKSFRVKWKKVSGASGYQVSYKTGKTTKKKTVNGGSKKSLKVTGLKSGKKYTVKVRAWKTVNGKKYYGKWSAAKKVTVK